MVVTHVFYDFYNTSTSVSSPTYELSPSVITSYSFSSSGSTAQFRFVFGNGLPVPEPTSGFVIRVDVRYSYTYSITQTTYSPAFRALEDGSLLCAGLKTIKGSLGPIPYTNSGFSKGYFGQGDNFIVNFSGVSLYEEETL